MKKDSSHEVQPEPTTPTNPEAPAENAGEAPVVFDLTEDPAVTEPATPDLTPTVTDLTPVTELTVTPSVGSVDMPDSVWVMIQALAKELLLEDPETRRYVLNEKLTLQVLGVIYTDDDTRSRAIEVMRQAAADWAETQPLDRAHAEPLP